MNLLYIRILTMNKVQRAIKHVSVTYFFAFLQRCHLNLQLHIWMGGISDGSSANVICMCELQFWGVYLMALAHMSSEHVNSSGGYIWWMSSENLNSFQVLLLLHRGLFCKRPTRWKWQKWKWNKTGEWNEMLKPYNVPAKWTLKYNIKTLNSLNL